MASWWASLLPGFVVRGLGPVEIADEQQPRASQRRKAGSGCSCHLGGPGPLRLPHDFRFLGLEPGQG